jgi:peptidase C13-like protein
MSFRFCRSRRAGALAWVIAVAMLALAATGARSAAPHGNWQVVLVAGDDAEPVFDDATRALAGRLAAAGVPAGNIHRLSANPAELHGGVELATIDNLLRRIAGLPARPGGRCLIFLTSHGERGAGLWLARSNRALSPPELARALSGGCKAVPTVVVVSGCYSGSFAAGAMAKPNRIILTAAREDRPSFGCQVGRTYTVYDQCLLAALPKAANWRAVFARTKSCVSRNEHAEGERPSEPQAYLGATVAGPNVGF